MKRIVGLSVVGLSLLALAACEPAAEHGNGNSPTFHKLTYKDALARAKKENKVVMIDFGMKG